MINKYINIHSFEYLNFLFLRIYFIASDLSLTPTLFQDLFFKLSFTFELTTSPAFSINLSLSLYSSITCSLEKQSLYLMSLNV